LCFKFQTYKTRKVVRTTKAALLFGPPGTGKTYLAKAAATAGGGMPFFRLSGDLLKSKWSGETEKAIMGLYQVANHIGPSIIFIGKIFGISKNILHLC
jgi:vacuolar protein-sorting-associated protein 4